MPEWIVTFREELGVQNFINVSNIWTVENIRAGFCTLRFSPTFTIDLNGTGADAFVADLLAKAVLPGGTDTIPAIMAKIKSQSTT
jgi:hypothetical protein